MARDLLPALGMTRSALVLLVAVTACGRYNTGVYDKLSLNYRSVMLARTPTRLSVSRYESGVPARYRARSLTCRPECQAEPLTANADAGPGVAAAEYLVTFGEPGPVVLEAVVERVEDGVLFADEFKVEVAEGAPPRLDVVHPLTGSLMPVSELSLVRGGSAVVCASTFIANTTVPVFLDDEGVQFTASPAEVVTLPREQHITQQVCRRVSAQKHGSSRLDVAVGGQTTQLKVDVVDPMRITSFSLVVLSGVSATDTVLGPAREPVASGSGSRTSSFRLEATTDDQRTVSIEPRCLTVKDGEISIARPSWNAPVQAVLLDAFTFSARTTSLLEWNSRACGQAAVPFSLRVVP